MSAEIHKPVSRYDRTSHHHPGDSGIAGQITRSLGKTWQLLYLLDEVCYFVEPDAKVYECDPTVL